MLTLSAWHVLIERSSLRRAMLAVGCGVDSPTSSRGKLLAALVVAPASFRARIGGA